MSSVEGETLLRQGVGAALVVHLQPGLLVDGDVHVERNILHGIRLDLSSLSMTSYFVGSDINMGKVHPILLCY